MNSDDVPLVEIDDDKIKISNKKSKRKQKSNKSYKTFPASTKNIVELIRDLAYPTKFVLDYDNIVIKSTLFDKHSAQQIENIVEAFNQGKKSIMKRSPVGKRIEPNNFRLVALNKQPELVQSSNRKYRKRIYLSPNNQTEELGYFDQTKLFFGEYGSFVINVPVGKVALAWKGNNPIILGQGPHVIHDPNLKKIKKKDLVDVNSQYISHGTLHIIRVPPNSICKIWLNYMPYILPPQKKSYVFNEAVFKKEKELTVLRNNYISHGNFHILQLPHGKIAKVWFGSQPCILEARTELREYDDGTPTRRSTFGEPYIYDDQTFRLEPKSEKENYEDATSRIIIHGSIKRIMPRTGEVAITYDNGKLITYEPQTNHKPILITNPNHSYEGFLTTNTQTIEFPSESTRRLRKKEAQSAEKTKTPDDDLNYNDINYEIFRTSDGLPIGVKILVVFEIENPDLTLRRLKPDQIIPHIEHLVVADMGRTILSATYVDFLSSDQTKTKSLKKNIDLLSDAHQIEFFQFLQDKVKNQLHDDFAEYGIKLVRLNFETPKILDQTISNKMAELSLISTTARAQEGVMDRNFKIAQTKAHQEAETNKIKQKQENENKVFIAEADQKSVQLQAEAELNAARMRAQAKLSETEAEVKGQQMLLEIAKQRAELYDNHPGLLQFDLAKIQAEAMRSIQSTIISPEIAQMYYGLNPMLMKNTFSNVDIKK